MPINAFGQLEKHYWVNGHFFINLVTVTFTNQHRQMILLKLSDKIACFGQGVELTGFAPPFRLESNAFFEVLLSRHAPFDSDQMEIEGTLLFQNCNLNEAIQNCMCFL